MRYCGKHQVKSDSVTLMAPIAFSYRCSVIYAFPCVNVESLKQEEQTSLPFRLPAEKD